MATTPKTVSKITATRTSAPSKIAQPTATPATPKVIWGRESAWTYLAIIIGLPQVLLAANTLLGLYANVISLAFLAYLAISQEQFRKTAISAALLPVAIMVSVSLPQSLPFAQSVIFYDSILILALVYRYMFTLGQPLNRTSLGWKGYAMTLPMLIVTGQILGVLAYGTLRHTYPFHEIPLGLVTTGMFVFAIAEEMFFRGLIQQNASDEIGPKLATALTVIAYIAATIPQGNIGISIFAAISGLILSIAYYKKQNLLLTITANVTLKLLFVGLIVTFS